MVDPVLNTTTGMRTCLRCMNKFKSIGPGNRICSECNSPKHWKGRQKNPMNSCRRGGIRDD